MAISIIKDGNRYQIPLNKEKIAIFTKHLQMRDLFAVFLLSIGTAWYCGVMLSVLTDFVQLPVLQGICATSGESADGPHHVLHQREHPASYYS